MSNLDLTPLFRSTVGFDRLFTILDEASRLDAAPNWPPYDIEKVDADHYRITMALAGFVPEDIELTQQGTSLLVTGRKGESNNQRQFMHRGIAGRTFRQTFNLADHVKVVGAAMENGLLTVDLARQVPEQLKPRKIEIGSSARATPVQDNQQKQIQAERNAA
jgi:molecular chaperone IbpA